MVVIPHIHSNGSSKKLLIKEKEKAYEAINEAIDALKQAAPNPRDYDYADSWGLAVQTHTERVQALHAIADEIAEEIDGIEKHT